VRLTPQILEGNSSNLEPAGKRDAKKTLTTKLNRWADLLIRWSELDCNI
jgi:hypothetical protein